MLVVVDLRGSGEGSSCDESILSVMTNNMRKSYVRIYTSILHANGKMPSICSLCLWEWHSRGHAHHKMTFHASSRGMFIGIMGSPDQEFHVVATQFHLGPRTLPPCFTTCARPCRQGDRWSCSTGLMLGETLINIVLVFVCAIRSTHVISVHVCVWMLVNLCVQVHIW